MQLWGLVIGAVLATYIWRFLGTLLSRRIDPEGVVFQWVFMGVMLLNDPSGAILDLRPYTNWITGAR